MTCLRIRLAGPLAIILALSACGGSSPAAPTPTPTPTPTPAANRAPVIATVTATPSFGIQNLTVFNFVVNASDPDGDPLTYTWNVAGNAFTGSSVGPLTFLNGFSNAASVTVSDGKGGSASGSANFIVGSLTGTWAGPFGPTGFAMSLTQATSGTASGIFAISANGVTITGQTDPASTNRIDANGNVTLRFKANANVSDFIFTGSMDTTGTRLTGQAQGSGFTGQSVILLKQ